MNLFTIQHQLIAGTTTDAWYLVGTAGTDFRYRWAYGTGADGPFSYVVDEHRSYAVCRQEPSLTMAWGMQVDPERLRAFGYDWAEEFADSSVNPIWADFLWNGALIDRVELADVDGGRGLIPMPTGREVTDFEVAVACLVHRLEGGADSGDPLSYLDIIGAKRVLDVARGGAGSPA